MKYVDVSETNFPLVFKAFREIDLDCGRINRLEAARSVYFVPGTWTGDLLSAEKLLTGLSDEDFSETVIGTEGKMLTEGVEKLLTAQFEEKFKGHE